MNKTITFTTPAFFQRTKEIANTIVGAFSHRKAVAYPIGSNAWKAEMWRTIENPVVKDLKDVRPGILYDRLTGAAGAATPAQLAFFITPKSATKTDLDTNLDLAGQLQGPQTFLVMAMRFIFSAMFPPDIESMIINYWLEFKVGIKSYQQGHFDIYPGGAGVYGALAGTVAAGSILSFAGNGVPDPTAVNIWGSDSGIFIGLTEVFKVLANSPAPPTLAAAAAAVAGYQPAGRGFNIRALLDGMHNVQVQ